AMSEALGVKHVVRYGSIGYVLFRREGESRFRINEAPNQPGRSGTIDSGPWPRNPKAILVTLPVDPGGLLLWLHCASRVGVRQEFCAPLLQWAPEKIHFHDLLKTAA